MGKVSVALDLVMVLVFVAIGRTAHAHGLTVAGLASTAWPFLAALAIGWLILAAGRRDGMTLSSGLVVWISTVALGMAFRVIAGQGTAVAFVFVALGFLGLTLLGWRIVALGIRRRRVAGRSPEAHRSATRGVSNPSG
ncbi:MAG TPA: DUF3054 domain-containing protein [Acidimicrobiales bacterium]|jgi:hypothetical protein|nr:DUF3054 domain-containing protein [Acidimicrobiales bacterium]